MLVSLFPCLTWRLMSCELAFRRLRLVSSVKSYRTVLWEQFAHDSDWKG